MGLRYFCNSFALAEKSNGLIYCAHVQRFIAPRFNWLNAQLRGKLPLGDAEARAWQKELLTDEDGFQQQLRALRQRLNDTATEATP